MAKTKDPVVRLKVNYKTPAMTSEMKTMPGLRKSRASPLFARSGAELLYRAVEMDDWDLRSMIKSLDTLAHEINKKTGSDLRICVTGVPPA